MADAWPTRRAGMYPGETAARAQLAACCRVFDLPGWSEMIVNHGQDMFDAMVRQVERTGLAWRN